MPCYAPLRAYQTRSGDIVFQELQRHGEITRSLDLPCGQCIGCRLERSRQWATRCVHEAQLHKHNSFITLTYEDTKLPEHGSLKYTDFQKFLKRLRKHTGPTKVRFYMCGEYGENTKRPHYHAALFGWDWPDKKYYSGTSNDDKLYDSALLQQLWGLGNTKTGNVTFESAAYIARYCVQKITGKNAKQHYGERTPEFNRMSLKPGIGATWFEKYKTDVYPHDYVVTRGKESKPPKYYDQLLARIDKSMFEEIKENRELDAIPYRSDQTPERLKAREQVAKARLNQLIRKEI